MMTDMKTKEQERNEKYHVPGTGKEMLDKMMKELNAISGRGVFACLNYLLRLEI